MSAIKSLSKMLYFKSHQADTTLEVLDFRLYSIHLLCTFFRFAFSVCNVVDHKLHILFLLT